MPVRWISTFIYNYGRIENNENNQNDINNKISYWKSDLFYLIIRHHINETITPEMQQYILEHDIRPNDIMRYEVAFGDYRSEILTL